MTANRFSVLFDRRFWPLFVSQFLGAANDNVFKNAIAILVIYRLGGQLPVGPGALVNLASGLFILPFFLFSATAGLVADRFEKTRLIRIAKAAEVGIAALGAASLVAESVSAMLVVLFLLGLQATFFGPLKYAVLPEQLREDELVAGNALVEGGTFLAILLGTIAGGLIVLRDGGVGTIAAMMAAMAVLGFAASLFLPASKPGNTAIRVGFDIVRETAKIIGIVRARRDLKLSVLGISWFWLVGIVYLSQFPAFAKDVLHADENAVTLMLTLFSVGIGAGSVLGARWLKGEISARHVPAASLAMALFAFDLWSAGKSAGLAASGPDIATLGAVLARPAVWRVLFDLTMLSVAGGVYIVPLYTILQARGEAAERARVIAGNNIANAAFMVAGSMGCAGLLALGLSVNEIFLSLAVFTLAVSFIVCGLLPHDLLKTVFVRVLRLLYRVEVRGLENLKAAGTKAVVAVNHVSFLDAVLMAAFLPNRPTFAVNSHIATRWWVRPFLALVTAYPMDPTNPMATRGLIAAVRQGRTCVIFPEGRITVTGALMKIYAGPGMIADKADAPVVPVRIDGAQYTPFSRLKGKVRRRLFPKITITILPPQRFDLPDDVTGRERRRRIGLQLYDLMSRMMYETSRTGLTLFAALAEAAEKNGLYTPAVEDMERRPLSYFRLMAASLILGRRIVASTPPGGAIGLLLPNSNAAAASFFAAQVMGRVPAMLNFTAGPANILAAATAAQIGTVITSRRFVELAKLSSVETALAGKVEILYLEDVRESITIKEKLAGLADALRADKIEASFGRKPDDPAVILFTSGSEGAPKGVVLSHANILANCNQLAARLPLSPSDTVFNALPVFHSFGLTGGLLLPLLTGVKCFLYPSPLHYRTVSEMIYDTNATLMFGTDTFLAGYARVASPYDFASVRLVFAGAEKVRETTRRAFFDKFGLRILEGYGTTETAPVLAVNTPMHNKTGSVGRILPGIESRVEPVEGVSVGGRLWVKGRNVMLGYLRAANPGVIEAPQDGWYDTGDIVSIDEDGFVQIQDRAKRFAKVAGEMVALGRVESEIASLWPRRAHAVVALPDTKKGERLILVTEYEKAARADVLAHFRDQGLAEFMVPKTIVTVERLPLLGTGKTDYLKVKAMLEEKEEETGGKPLL